MKKKNLKMILSLSKEAGDYRDDISFVDNCDI
jgi:hypothetical protein